MCVCTKENQMRKLFITVCELDEVSYLPEGNPLTFDMGNGYIVSAANVYVDPIMYPDLSVIDRCAMMHDSGDQTEKMLEMWSRVKGDNLSPWMLAFIIVSFTIIVVWIVWHKVDAYRKQRAMLKRHHHARKQQK